MLHPVHRCSASAIGDRLVLSSIESIDDKDPQLRLVLVTTYNYGNGTTTRTLVDLESTSVFEKRTTRDGIANLTEGEANEAKALVLRDARVKEILGESNLEAEVDVLLMRTLNPNAEFYGGRVVMALLRTRLGYIASQPKILGRFDQRKGSNS